jgi:serine/threonine protein kinase/tetratricopeptide (TPR) repeat protein
MLDYSGERERPMIGKTISHFKITKKLGEGGMGEVYLAQDLDLDRTVALKFLKHFSPASDADRSRFQREAQAAASLDHPNICTVYEIGQADGVTFIAMAYVDGAGVDVRVDSGPLPLSDTVDIGTQIADGLHAAHDKGIVHRDIKSANVIVDDKGRAKITDFGLALREGQSRLTQDGLSVGTSAYMSPEQCRGDQVDERTDIWALGVVLYEMITARLPFAAAHNSAIVYAILNQDPEPITALRSRVPMELERIVEKALAKDPDRRYQHVDELAADLKGVRETIESSTGGKPVTTAARRGSRLRSPVPWIAASAVAAVIAAVIVFYPTQTVPFTERGWMIIADFENETNEEVFDGLVSEALSIDLQQSKHVNLYSRQRIDQTLQRMGKDCGDFLEEETAREVALREGVSAVLGGSVNKVGASYVLTARIVVPSTGDVVQTVRSEAKDSGKVLDAIDHLSKHVRRDLGESVHSIWRHDKPLAQVTTGSLQALQYYSKAANLMSGAHWDDALPLLHQAIEEDSTFAIAYSKLGVIYHNMNDLGRAARYSGMARDRVDRVTDRERHYIEARYWEDRGDRKQANENYKLLVQMYPDDFVGRNNLAFALQFSYEYEEALEHALAAAKLDPDSWYSHHNLASVYAGAGKYDLSIESAHRAQAINPQGYWSYIGEAWVYCCRGDEPAAHALLDKLPSDNESWYSLKLWSLAATHRMSGQDDQALEYLQEGVSIDELAGRSQAAAWKWAMMAFIRRDRDDLEGALTALRTAERLEKPVHIMMHLGYAYAAMGDWARADSVLAELEAPWDWEKSHADLAWIERYRGELAMARGDYEAAAEFFDRSIVMKENLETRYRLGQALRMTGRYEGAIEQFAVIDQKRYGTIFENVPWIWPKSFYETGLAYQATGDSENAAAAFERFLTLWKDADPGRKEVADARHRLESL